MRRPLIAGNWKMHKNLAEARELVAGIHEGLDKLEFADGVDVLICPPFTLLFPIAKALAHSQIRFGAQNVHESSDGAFTGEISVPMLQDTGCTHVILGHSERRRLFSEQNDRLARKVRAAINAGLNVIYCVGETPEQRQSGRTRAVIESQLNKVVGSDLAANRLIVAYEPVWAIGTGRTATSGQAQQVHEWIRASLAETFDPSIADGIRILYGGSVNPENAADLLARPDIDGALVGGACLVAADFVAIIAAAAASVPA